MKLIFPKSRYIWKLWIIVEKHEKSYVLRFWYLSRVYDFRNQYLNGRIWNFHPQVWFSYYLNNNSFFCFPLFLWHVESFICILNRLLYSFMCKLLDIHWSFVRLHIYIMIISLLLVYNYILFGHIYILLYSIVLLYN